MVKKNSNFFEQKSEWAYIKDGLLECYLSPYIAKILMTGRPLLYVDCFAGKGAFDDGNPGSPLIAARIIEQSLESSSAKNPKVKGVFVDKEYSDDLAKNLPDKDYFQSKSGTFEDTAEALSRSKNTNANLFLYIDPYGIVSLDMGFFDKIAEHFPSVEILLNLNTFGFFREACRVFGVDYRIDEASDDFLVERDAWNISSLEKSEHRLSTIAGGEYWKSIVGDYRAGAIDGYEAEKRFAEKYCKRLMSSYRYVQHFPIRVKEGNRPKYRMLHATCHPEGATLMYENMYKRKETLITQLQKGGQLSIFEESAENEYFDLDDLIAEFKAYVRTVKFGVDDHTLLADFIVRHGVLCSLKEYRNAMRDMEKSGEIIITRDPAFTAHGNPSSFIESKGDHSLLIRSAS